MNNQYHALRFASIAIWGTFIVLLAAFCTLLLWVFEPYTLPEIKEPIKVLNENHIVAHGEPILMEIEVNKTDELTPRFDSNRVECTDGSIAYFSSSKKEIPLGVHTIMSSSNIMPTSIPVGSDCQFVFFISYEVNPIRFVNATWKSETFKVIGGHDVSN